MISIQSLKVGHLQYYASLDRADYYHSSDADSYWLPTKGAERWGLSGRVDPTIFENLFLGKSVDGEASLVKSGKTHHPGTDVTCSAPKSVSILANCGITFVENQVAESHRKAVEAAANYLENVACFTRRGAGGVEKEAISPIIASFTHHASRENDPNLHTHLVVLNVCERSDGTFGAIMESPLFSCKMSAGALYRAELSHQLETRLGLVMERDGEFARVKEVPRSLEKAFSTRRQQIEEKLEALNANSSRAAEVATLSTRSPKVELPLAELRERWQAVASEHGLTEDYVIGMLSRSHRPELQEDRLEKAIVRAVDRLNVSVSDFSSRDLVRTVAEECVAESVSASALTDRVQELLTASPEITFAGFRHGEARYLTKEMVEQQSRIVANAEFLASRDRHSIERRVVESAIAENPTLNAEQASAIRHVTAAPGDIQTVEGLAGTGKTRTLQVAHEIWKEAGYDVIGMAPSGKAARELEAGSQIPSTTIHRRLWEFENGVTPVDSNTILVVDEAGMVPNHLLDKILFTVKDAGAKVVLQGDTKQLQSVEAGGGFATINKFLKPAELTEIRRQEQEWAREAIRQIVNGNAEAALWAYDERGLLTVADDRTQAIDKLIEDWSVQGVRDPEKNLILVGTNREADYANQLAHAARHEAGVLGSANWTIGGKTFHEGERILFTKNFAKYGVANGTTGTFLRMIEHQERDCLLVRGDDGRECVVPLLDCEKHVKLGYAMTTHKAQGCTVDNAFCLVGGGMQDRELSYVQLSRARKETRLYADKHEVGMEFEDLSRQMRKSNVQELGLDPTNRSPINTPSLEATIK